MSTQLNTPAAAEVNYTDPASADPATEFDPMALAAWFAAARDHLRHIRLRLMDIASDVSHDPTGAMARAVRRAKFLAAPIESIHDAEVELRSLEDLVAERADDEGRVPPPLPAVPGIGT